MRDCWRSGGGRRGARGSPTAGRADDPLWLILGVAAADGPDVGGHTHTVAGTVGTDGRGQITSMDSYEVSLDLGGKLLFISHRDQPGRIGAVGTLLGERGINIAAMQVGRRKVRGTAVMIVTLD